MPGRKKQTNWLVYLIGLGVIVVILVLVFGRGVPKLPVPTPTPVDTQVQQLQTLSTSDEFGAIEADLNNTNLDQIDTELKEVENSLQGL